MSVSRLMRAIATVSLVVALSGAAAGCVSDMGAQATDGSSSGSQLRYYGGPKSPMWAGQ